jgi:SAM-dependent methyltransferase
MQQRARYGVDAPGLVVALIVVGTALALMAVAALAWPQPSFVRTPAGVGAGFVAAILLSYAAVMLRSSLVGKMGVRDRLVGALALSGGERVLDAGCGLGLGLIGCAKQLTTGQAVGIDLWSRDLSGNRPEGTRANAAIEGVADRVEVETGDITRLPFTDGAFDVVISMSVIHNIHPQASRDQALGELVRVLKPGGRIAIFDLLNTPRYAEVLRGAGLEVRSVGRDRLWLFPGDSLLARKPEHASTRGASPPSSHGKAPS